MCFVKHFVERKIKRIRIYYYEFQYHYQRLGETVKLQKIFPRRYEISSPKLRTILKRLVRKQRRELILRGSRSSQQGMQQSHIFQKGRFPAGVAKALMSYDSCLFLFLQRLSRVATLCYNVQHSYLLLAKLSAEPSQAKPFLFGSHSTTFYMVLYAQHLLFLWLTSHFSLSINGLTAVHFSWVSSLFSWFGTCISQ